ncbi:hypothetical protein HXX76_011874 [Chlamydomonas incerta]|uniref:Major facilitator superfamily (MFS) profile domain-containing protein n=1 Tax=Chlamydomonas incerta TaxID=51695 RepID=A0A835STV8_CHLIN|nr:hypothetical protein HXX76_011874 [Chlamydomonas incerta]|eukprot:KAG2428194.1 hypothetical protein HXX76_011874 [Chlamydomonas incerta]
MGKHNAVASHSALRHGTAGTGRSGFHADGDDAEAGAGHGLGGLDKGGREAADDDDMKVDTVAMFNKVSTRLLPLFFVMVIMCYVDRTSLAFAAIQLNADLGFPPAVYGMGSGLFFLGYSLFQVPSNLLLKRVGGPTWLAVIIFAWGLAASAFAGMKTATHFYVLRLVLGVAEAGAFPGMWYMLTKFFPGDQLAFPFAVVEAGISLSHVLAAPLAAACLSLDGLGGLAGWRWLFLVEGLPTLLLAVVMYRTLPRGPESAPFLSPAERRALQRRLELHARSQGELGSGGAGHGPAAGGGADGSSANAPAAVASGGSVVKRSSKARSGQATPTAAAGTDAAGAGTFGGAGGASAGNSAHGGGTAHSHAHGAGTGACGGGGGSSGSGGGGTTWQALRAALTNKFVWYLGFVKFVRDIASFGLIFWAPTIVNALIAEMREGAEADDEADGGARRTLLGGAVVPPPGGAHGTGLAAVLLTSLPFAAAAGAGMALAHSSQRCGERFFHIGVPYLITGAILSLYSVASDRSPWLGFAALGLGIVGNYCGSGPGLALLSELAAGPGLVVALPLYNSIGVFGGFLGPTLVGWLVQRARDDAEGEGEGGAAAALHGGGFGVSAMVLGAALAMAGVLTLALGAWLGRLGPGLQQILGSSAAAGGARGGAGGAGGSGRGEGDESAPLLMVVDSSAGGGSRGSGSGSDGVLSLEVVSQGNSQHGGLASAGGGLPPRA